MKTWLATLLTAAALGAAEVHVDFAEKLGPLKISQMALGQGGLSDHVMWDNRITEIRALHPAVIRLFIQEYFNLLPAPDRYHFDTLDKSVDAILKTGATPLMCICFKPRLLFPEINQDIVEPNNYAAWEKLIFSLVQHYKGRGANIRYWEIANEPDIGEDGGCPFRFKPQNYVPFFQHTAAAILKADPTARVGGPAVANSRSPLVPALLDAAASNAVPLHFVSWHIYSSDPKSVGRTVEYIKELLASRPTLKVETFLDEWNMDLTNPPLDPRFQPAYVAETVWQMKEAGLDYSCYYHIRDYYVALEQFTPIMSERGAAFMARWWNRMPQFDGLFDYQNTIRPAYFAFKLLSRLQGERLRVTSDLPHVHAFAADDPILRMQTVMLWNYSREPAEVTLHFDHLPKDGRTRHITLDAAAPTADENARLRPEPFQPLKHVAEPFTLQLEPYAIHYWSFE